MRIKEIRIVKGITQKVLAEKVGLNPATLSKYESGKIIPDALILKSIAKVLNVDINVLYDDYIENKSFSDDKLEEIKNILLMGENEFYKRKNSEKL
ncbi:MAG: helix-turn-helix transcriptional regulator [Clostridia bacterium]|nr:helix-turn-helix transcriptional regulator [Clostridia bacterium]